MAKGQGKKGTPASGLGAELAADNAKKALLAEEVAAFASKQKNYLRVCKTFML